MNISDFFIKGDIKGAIRYMKENEKYKDILPLYISLFEEEKYIEYDIPPLLNDILRQYQIYYRNIFYLEMKEDEASSILKKSLREILNVDSEDESLLVDKLQEVFLAKGYNSLFGRTQGLYGPYIWKETVPTTYEVELPHKVTKYKVNILKGFVFRSFMDYLTFGRFGTGGWASKDGTINCIEKAYDFSSERFLISLLKHEAQHLEDMKRYPSITTEELEYRAKLVELYYSNDLNLINKFIFEASGEREGDSHSLASSKIKRNFIDIDLSSISSIKKRAIELFDSDSEELDKKYNIK